MPKSKISNDSSLSLTFLHSHARNRHFSTPFAFGTGIWGQPLVVCLQHISSSFDYNTDILTLIVTYSQPETRAATLKHGRALQPSGKKFADNEFFGTEGATGAKQDTLVHYLFVAT